MPTSKDLDALLRSSLDDLWKDDFLGAAADARHQAARAVREKRYDDAWRLLHDEKTNYLKHAQRCRFTARQTLALDGSVHEQFANIHRLEGNHHDALVHLLYCIATNDRPSKALRAKVPAYFKRCNFTSVSLADVERTLLEATREPNIRALQSAVASWRQQS